MARAPKKVKPEVVYSDLEVRVGNRTKKFGPTDTNQAADFINGELEQRVVEEAVKKFKVLSKERLTAMKEEIEKAGDRELAKLGPWIARSLMGVHSAPLGGVQTFFLADVKEEAGEFVLRKMTRNDKLPKRPQKFQWRALSLTTKKKKGHARHFIDTGALRSFFQQNAAKIVEGLGGVKVYYQLTSSQTPRLPDKIADLSKLRQRILITLVPKVGKAIGPYLSSGDITSLTPASVAKAAKFPKDVIEKLEGIPFQLRGKDAGKEIVDRPLFEPALAFWLSYRMPSALGKAVSKAILKTTTRKKRVSSPGAQFEGK